MADVYNFIIPTGTITTDTGEILTEVQNEFKNTFGADLIVTPETPQGALIVSETLARIAVANNNAALANQINPNLAGGVYLDALLALTGAIRTPARYSYVLVTITGTPGTLIPAGSQVSETGSGNAYVFVASSDVLIPTGGTIDNVTFQSAIAGAIPANANTLTQIISGILGWATVTNPFAATLGQAAESDAQARFRRRQTLFTQGTSLAGAIISSVIEVPGVTSVSFRENVSDTTQVIDGVTMLPHSIYVCVTGAGFFTGDVAEAILNKKSAGAGFNNGASSFPEDINVLDQYSGQLITVSFDVADTVPISVLATVSVNSSVQDPVTAVKTAILDYAAGEIDGEPGLGIGSAVSSFELAGAVTLQSPGIFVHNLQIKKTSGGSYSTNEIPIAIFEIATIIESSITVNVI